MHVRGSLRLHLFGTLVLLPIIVATVITAIGIRLFHGDKELYVYDLSAQSVELVARNLASRLESLRLKAELTAEAAPPFLSISRGEGRTSDPIYLVENVSQSPDQPRLRVHVRARGGKSDLLTLEIRPESLLDLRGYGGPTKLMVVNREGQILDHPDLRQVGGNRRVTDLLRQLKPFSTHGAKAGTREVRHNDQPTLAAFSRVGDQLAVLQTIDRRQVSAASKPLVTSAVVASLVVVVIAVLVALLLGRTIIRPLKLMARQAEAIGRGEFGVAVQTQSAAEMSQLMHSFNAMSAALKTREEELQQVQRKLLESERLNAASRMIANIVKELSEPLEQCFVLASQTRHRLPESSVLRDLQKQVMEEANRASNILQNLSRLSSHEESPTATAEPDIIISDVLISSRPLFEKQQLQVTTDLDTQLGRVTIGPEQLRNALLDIFLYVTSQARPATAVQVTLKRHDSAMLLNVAFGGQASDTRELASAASIFEEQGGGLRLEGGQKVSHIVVSLPIE